MESGPHLELPSSGEVFDPFKRFVLLPVHVQTVHLQACREQEFIVRTTYCDIHLLFVLPDIASC